VLAAAAVKGITFSVCRLGPTNICPIPLKSNVLWKPLRNFFGLAKTFLWMKWYLEMSAIYCGIGGPFSNGNVICENSQPSEDLCTNEDSTQPELNHGQTNDLLGYTLNLRKLWQMFISPSSLVDVELFYHWGFDTHLLKIIFTLSCFMYIRVNPLIQLVCPMEPRKVLELPNMGGERRKCYWRDQKRMKCVSFRMSHQDQRTTCFEHSYINEDLHLHIDIHFK